MSTITEQIEKKYIDELLHGSQSITKTIRQLSNGVTLTAIETKTVSRPKDKLEYLQYVKEHDQEMIDVTQDRGLEELHQLLIPLESN